MGNHRSRRERLGLVRASVLQGFSPEFPWRGTLGRRFAQVGNAVCPPVARVVLAEAMRPSLLCEVSA